MAHYTFKNEQGMSPQELRKAEKVANKAIRLGVPFEFAEDAMWELNLSAHNTVLGAARDLLKLYREYYELNAK